MKKILFSLALMSALLVSCEKPENGENNPEPTPEPEYSISISPAELTFGAEGGEQSVTVTSSEGWHLVVDSDWYWSESDGWYRDGEVSWYGVSAYYGGSGDEILIKANPNTDAENSRSAKLVFTCGDKTAELAVNQKKDEIIEFKDPAFLKAILLHDAADKNGDKKISKAEAALITSLSVGASTSGPQIRVMDEIKYFTALTILYCDYNQLTSLDLSNNTALTELSCSGNQLTSLDLSNNTALTDLRCSNNQLTSLDLSGCAALTYLNCYGNQLTSLDLSKNTALTELDCAHNQLTSLDLSKNTALESLSCYSNQLTSLDVSNNTALTILQCEYNQLTSLDLSNNTALTELECYSNDITSLDVSMCRGLEIFEPVFRGNYDTKLPLESLKIYKYHIIDADDMSAIEKVYGDIIEYVE